MPHIVTQKNIDWNKQPPYTTQINWSNPISNGLVRVDNFALLGYDLLGGPSWGNVGYLPTINGMSLAQQGDSTPKIITNPNLHTKIINGITVLSVVWRAGTPSASEFFIQHGRGSSNYNWGLYDSGGGARWFFLKNTSGTIANPNFTYTGSGWGVVVGTYSDTLGNVKIYQDGIFKAQYALTGQIQQTDYYLGSFNFQGGSGTYRQPLILIWNRSLSSTEIYSISKNPWQVFKKKQQLFHIYIDSGSGTIYTITPTGSISLLGSVTQLHEKSWIPSGSLSLAGTNLITFTNGSITYTIIPSGSISLSGTNETNRYHLLVPQGNVTLSGNAKELRTRAVLPVGSVEFLGEANVAEVKVFSPSGLVTFSGTAQLYMPGMEIESTKLPLTGVGS